MHMTKVVKQAYGWKSADVAVRANTRRFHTCWSACHNAGLLAMSVTDEHCVSYIWQCCRDRNGHECSARMTHRRLHN